MPPQPSSGVIGIALALAIQGRCHPKAVRSSHWFFSGTTVLKVQPAGIDDLPHDLMEDMMRVLGTTPSGACLITQFGPLRPSRQLISQSRRVAEMNENANRLRRVRSLSVALYLRENQREVTVRRSGKIGGGVAGSGAKRMAP